MIPLWKGKNPIYFGVITIIPFDNLYRRAYFVMHTFLVPFQICAPVYFSWMSGARLSYIDTFSHLVTNIIKGPFELMASLCVLSNIVFICHCWTCTQRQKVFDQKKRYPPSMSNYLCIKKGFKDLEYFYPSQQCYIVWSRC